MSARFKHSFGRSEVDVLAVNAEMERLGWLPIKRLDQFDHDFFVQSNGMPLDTAIRNMPDLLFKKDDFFTWLEVKSTIDKTTPNYSIEKRVIPSCERLVFYSRIPCFICNYDFSCIDVMKIRPLLRTGTSRGGNGASLTPFFLYWKKTVPLRLTDIFANPSFFEFHSAWDAARKM